MANQKLQGTYYKIPEKLTNHLTKILNAYKGPQNAEGYKRLKDLTETDKISYEQLKAIKNFFDSYSGGRKDSPYLLNGGSIMKGWVETTLSNIRDGVEGKKKSMKDVGMDNQFIKTHDKNGVRIDPHDSDTNKILRQEGIYNMDILKSLITTIDKNRELCLMVK